MRQSTMKCQRQQAVAKELSRFGSAAKAEIPRLSVDLATSYATKTAKTVTRDLNALVKLGLVLKDADGRYRVNRASVYSLLPPRF